MTAIVTGGPIEVLTHDKGTLWQVQLAVPKGNILDRDMTRALTQVFKRAARESGLVAIVLEGQGRHFSFGASVEEHLPGEVEAMIPEFHELFRAMFRARIFVAAAVRGQCLGGGLELALFAHRIFAHPDACLGQPEIRLGVFAPVASVLLPERIGRARAEDLLLTGRSIQAAEALAIGLVDEVAQDPTARACDYIRTAFGAHSAESLRHAIGAARAELERRFLTDIDALECAYLGPLMTTDDAVEGIRAFIEKRPPDWRNR